MSEETLDWLNSMTLIGNTDKRGTAWHYEATMQGDEPNHYAGPIPVADVRRRLFDWKVGPSDVFYGDDSGIHVADGFQAMVAGPGAPFPGQVFGIFKDGYRGHDYQEWLVNNVERILDDQLHIGSAGLLRKGAVAWVQVEVPDTVTTPSGIAFRPYLLAGTSYDGSFATFYKEGSKLVVCDNTLTVARRAEGRTFTLKHTRHSVGRILEAREALGIVFQHSDEVSAAIEKLLQTEVTPKVWTGVLDRIVPIPQEQGRSRTLAEHKREDVVSLYLNSPMVEPWRGTGFGVLQAFNTYDQHFATVRNASRPQRNHMNALGGTTQDRDNAVLAALEAELALAA